MFQEVKRLLSLVCVSWGAVVGNFQYILFYSDMRYFKKNTGNLSSLYFMTSSGETYIKNCFLKWDSFLFPLLRWPLCWNKSKTCPFPLPFSKTWCQFDRWENGERKVKWFAQGHMKKLAVLWTFDSLRALGADVFIFPIFYFFLLFCVWHFRQHISTVFLC